MFTVFRADAWLTKGIAGYLSCLFQKKTFGNNEYRYMIAQVNITTAISGYTLLYVFRQSVTITYCFTEHIHACFSYYFTEHIHACFSYCFREYIDMYFYIIL